MEGYSTQICVEGVNCLEDSCKAEGEGGVGFSSGVSGGWVYSL